MSKRFDPYRLKKPCANCPFLKDAAKAIRLHPDRVPSIIEDLLSGRSTGFSCHKTLGPPERWRDVPEFEGLYRVSDLGRVKRLSDGQILASGQSGEYIIKTLTRAGVQSTHSVHSLVLRAFRGPRPVNMVGRHLDGNGKNNRLENLVWGTQKENADDRERHGRTARGEKQGLNRLTREQVDEIKEALKSEVKGQKGKPGTVAQLAEKFGISRGQIYNIKNGLSWAWVDTEVDDPSETATGYQEDENGDEKYVAGDGELQCAGSLAVLEKLGRQTQLMQIMQRMGAYNPDDLIPIHDLVIDYQPKGESNE